MTSHLGKLSSLEFAVMWEVMSDDYLPFPISHLPEQQYEDDYVRAKRAVVDRLAPLISPDMLPLWETVVRPDIVISAMGGDEHDGTNMRAVSRVLGVRRGGTALVLTQQPGPTISHGGDVDFYETSVVDLAKSVIEKLPKADRGKMREIPIIRRQPGELDYSYGRSLVRDSVDESPFERSERWLRAPSTQAGDLEVQPGSAVHWLQERKGYLIRWRDLADDGRYVIEAKKDPIAVPADAGEFERIVNSKVADLVRRIRENRPADNEFRVTS